MFGELLFLFWEKYLWYGRKREQEGLLPREKGKERRNHLRKNTEGIDKRWGASLIYFRMFTDAKPPGQHWGFRNCDISGESI